MNETFSRIVKTTKIKKIKSEHLECVKVIIFKSQKKKHIWLMSGFCGRRDQTKNLVGCITGSLGI